MYELPEMLAWDDGHPWSSLKLPGLIEVQFSLQCSWYLSVSYLLAFAIQHSTTVAL